MSQFSTGSDLLLTGETIKYETDFHWVIFFSLKSFLTLFLSPILDRWTSEFLITNKRVIIKTGLIARSTLEMNIRKIESVNVEQTVMGRILGYGDIHIIGTGGTKETFRQISKPITFRKHFQEYSL